MAISLGILTQHFQTNPNHPQMDPQVIPKWIQSSTRLHLATRNILLHRRAPHVQLIDLGRAGYLGRTAFKAGEGGMRDYMSIKRLGVFVAGGCFFFFFFRGGVFFWNPLKCQLWRFWHRFFLGGCRFGCLEFWSPYPVPTCVLPKAGQGPHRLRLSQGLAWRVVNAPALMTWRSWDSNGKLMGDLTINK